MKTKDIIVLALILTAYTIIACVGLAFVYGATVSTIKERAKSDLEAALKEIFPAADQFKKVSISSPDPGVTFKSAYGVVEGGRFTGAILEAAAGSYSGPITVLVGVNRAGTIGRIKVMEHSDTPGLGANAAKPNYYVNRAEGITFTGQFNGKAVSDPFEPKNDVAAITAATITSRAVSRAVKVSGQAALEWLAEKGGAEQ